MEMIRQEYRNRVDGKISMGYLSVFSVLILALCTLLSLSILSCSKNRVSDLVEEKAVIVFAAASLTNVAEELAFQFTEKEKIPVIINTASSSTLARQIEQGSSADLYFSANKKWADYLLDLEILDSKTIVVIAKNSLVLIVPSDGKSSNNDSAENIKNIYSDKETFPAGFLSSGRIALGDPDHVPAGMYGKEALSSLGIYASIKDRFIPCSSVRDALFLVEKKETKWGIVYKTDALASSKVSLVGEFSGNLHTPIFYYLGVVNSSKKNETVNLFYQFCLSKEGKSIYKKYGFIPEDTEINKGESL